MKLILAPTDNQAGIPSNAQMNSITVESPDDELNVHDALELFKSAMLAFGYQPENIDKIKIVDDAQ